MCAPAKMRRIPTFGGKRLSFFAKVANFSAIRGRKHPRTSKDPKRSTAQLSALG